MLDYPLTPPLVWRVIVAGGETYVITGFKEIAIAQWYPRVIQEAVVSS